MTRRTGPTVVSLPAPVGCRFDRVPTEPADRVLPHGTDGGRRGGAAARPPEAELRMADCTAAHTRYGTARNASVVLVLALPPGPEKGGDAPWRLHTLKGGSPTRFRLATAAFDGPARPRTTGGRDTGRSFVLHGGALTVSTGGTAA
ncbi:hypothetical protein ACFV1B_16950 [Streptomyces sp. NPDC059637]